MSRAADALKPRIRWGLGHALPKVVLGRAARRGDLQAQLVRSTGRADPFPLLEQVRGSGAIHRGRFAFMTPSLETVKEVLSSSDFRSGIEPEQMPGPLTKLFRWSEEAGQLGPLLPPSLLVTEPPDHTRYRKLVSRVFSVKAVEALRARTEAIADALLDDLEGRDEVDIVATYCTLLPVTVIAEILGVPLADRDKVLSFGAGAAPSLDLGLSWRQFRAVEGALAGFEAWLDGHLGALRADPGADLLSQLVLAQDDGVGLDDRELKATAGLILAAGFETTVNLLGSGISLLCQHRSELDVLRADPSVWPNAVDEILRLEPPVLLTGRTTLRETTVAGMRLPKGALVTTLLAAANRDPAVFADPTRFDVRRVNAREHVSFSAGRHFCLGAALARMEGEVGLRRLFDRHPDLRLAPGAVRRTTRILRGWEVLPVRLGQ